MFRIPSGNLEVTQQRLARLTKLCAILTDCDVLVPWRTLCRSGGERTMFICAHRSERRRPRTKHFYQRPLLSPTCNKSVNAAPVRAAPVVSSKTCTCFFFTFDRVLMWWDCVCASLFSPGKLFAVFFEGGRKRRASPAFFFFYAQCCAMCSPTMQQTRLPIVSVQPLRSVEQ